MFPTCSFRRILVALSVLLLAVAPVSAAPRDELLPLVPGDMSLCLVVNNLREHSKAVQKAPWVAKFAKTNLGKQILWAPELKIPPDLKQLFPNADWQKVHDNILGDCIVFAYRPGEKKEDERGLLLMWVKDNTLLDKLLDQIIEAEKAKRAQKEFQGITYSELLAPNKEHQFFLREKSVFAFTSHEPTLQHVIARLGKKAPAPTPLVKSFERLKAESALLTFWINPRAFDAAWQPRADEPAPAAAVKKEAARYWQALDAVALTLGVAKDLELSLALQGDLEKLPAPAQKFLETLSVRSELWDLFPSPSLLTVAARVDAASLLQMVQGFLTPAARQDMESGLQKKFGAVLLMDFVKDALPCLGPDVGLCIAPRPDGKGQPDLLFALRLQPGKKGMPVDQVLINSIKLGAAGFNLAKSNPADFLKIASEKQDGILVEYLMQRDFPPGIQPAFALKGGYLVLASSPDAIKRFGSQPKAPKTAGAPLLRLSFPELAQTVKVHRQWLLNSQPAKDLPPGLPLGQWFDDLTELLGVFDHLHIHQHFSPGQLQLTARVQMAGAE